MPSARASVESDFARACLYPCEMPSHWELIILAIALVLIFGSKRMPEIGRSLGRGARELKQTVSEVDPRQDLKRVLEDEQPEKPAETRPPEESR